MRLEPTMMRSYHGQEVEVARCQGVNTSDWRAGQQCANQVRAGQTYCYRHRHNVFDLGDAEVCIQFNDDEPVVVFDPGPDASGPVSIEFTQPFTEEGSHLTFDDGRGKRFRLFVRRRRRAGDQQ